ncbi:MAG: TerC/Alx family metal homeostasis membrane protein [Bacteroidetes bacterium]|nr:TerC/Alx family metal homeostasis membrane protein [Bacteroidota bacterium]MBS1648385.1 TerC/Alx family metal homeostasis membrane protein [Bacteroidota bacterium]
MSPNQIVYTVFAIVLIVALIFDLGLLSKKNKLVTIKAALWQTLLWVVLALGFFIFLLYEENKEVALQYLSAYLMEWSLSIDNIFVFVLIFTSFKVKEQYYSRVLLAGVLMAIIFRVIFITVGVELVERFSWILYLFGIFLLYTGYKMFIEKEEKKFNPHENKVYKFLNRFLPLTPDDGNGKYVIRKNGKPQYTILFVVVIMLATIDLVFALDSIPAVMGISQNRLVIYTSNIFAVLGLRSLFFLLRGAVNKFQYLQQGIAIVLIIIGLKMLGEHWINEWLDKNIQVMASLMVILLCIGGSMFFSVIKKK